MHWHCIVFWGKSLLDNIPKVEAITATISLSPIDFWQCKGCRPPQPRTVGTRLGRRAPWEQASQATPINQIGSISVTVMTIIIIIIIIMLSPVKLLTMRSVEQKKFSLVGELMPTCSMEVQVQSQPKLKDNIYKDHWQWQFAQATLHSQPKNFYTAPTHPTPKKIMLPPPLPARLGILLSLFLVSRFKNPHFFQQISEIPLE